MMEMILGFLVVVGIIRQMIRGCRALWLVASALLLVSALGSFEQIEITRASRMLTLSGAYPSEQIKITFVANEDGVGHFTYLSPLEYDRMATRVSFSKSERDRSTLAYERSTFSYEGLTYAKYRVELPSKYQVGDIGDLWVQVVYLYRYGNLPASITLTEDQKLQFEDVKFLVSPYHALNQESTYKFAKLLEHDPDGAKKGPSEVQFSAGSLQPYSRVKHTVFGVNNNPQVQFTSVEKVIEISHWGNVGLTESYKIVNKGPSLKGEFSRVTFGSKGYDIKNAFKGIDFDLPYEVWGLYYLDEVGNISTSKAFRDDSSDLVRVSLMPRFSLLGGWKSNWQLGYNINTNGHLFRSGQSFHLRDIRLEYALERIHTEQFTVKVVLPEGVTNVRIKIGSQEFSGKQLLESRTEGYLDFNGRPTFMIPHYQGSTKDRDIEVLYDYSSNRVFQKPLVLALIMLGFLSFAILLQRFKLEAFSAQKQE